MGKITGFIEIDRQERSYAPVKDRVRNWQEFVVPLPERGALEIGVRAGKS